MFAIGTSVFGAYVVSGLVEASGRLRWQRIEAVETGERGRLRTLGAVAPERVERWRRLDAPAVLRPLRAAQAGDAVVVALEDVPYPTLADVLAQQGRFDPRRAVQLLLPVLSALEAIHAADLDVGLAPDEIALVPTRDGAQATAAPRLLFVRPEVGTPWRARARGLAALAHALLVGRDPFTADAREALEWDAEVPPLRPPSAIRPQLDPRWDVFVDAAWAGADAPSLRAALEDLITVVSAPPTPRVSAEVLAETRAAGARSLGAEVESRAELKKRALAGVGLAVALVLGGLSWRALDDRASSALRAAAGHVLVTARVACRGQPGEAKLGVDAAGRVFGVWASAPELEQCLTRVLVVDAVAAADAPAALGVLAFDGATGAGALRTVKPSWRLLKLDGAVDAGALARVLEANLTAVTGCAIRAFGGKGDEPLPVHFTVAPGQRVARVVAGHGIVAPTQAEFRTNTPVAWCVEARVRGFAAPPGAAEVMTSVSFRVGAPLAL
jgi:hypothetical protein